MNTNRKSSSNAEAQLITGIQKHLGSDGSLIVEGKKYTTADLVKALQERVDAREAAITAKAASQKAILDERSMLKSTNAFYTGARQALAIMFRSSVDALTDFGLTPRKTKRALTVEEKQGMVTRVLATRAARHTVGPKARQLIHGNPAIVASPPPAPTAPIVHPTPEGPTPPATGNNGTATNSTGPHGPSPGGSGPNGPSVGTNGSVNAT